MMLLTLGLAFSGFAGLCLGNDKVPRPREVKQAPLSPRTLSVLRWGGWLLLAAAFATAVARFNWGQGPVLWLGALTIAGIVMTYGLAPYRPKWIIPLAVVLPVLGIVAAVV